MNESFMHRCLSLASLGRGKVGNGALVGAVLVRGNQILADGYHAEFGEPHAERSVLEAFDQQIDADDVLYVNMEPCCAHATKKTPPCTDIILERGLRRVVYGMRDPDERVAGQGIQALREAGVEVIPSRLTALCESVNRGFISVRSKGRPWLTVKSAHARDGSIANRDGSPKRITSEIQDAWSHEYLRARHDAILVGVGTILKDDPSLTIRFIKGFSLIQNIDQLLQPYRIVLDPHLRIPEAARVLTDAHRDRTILIHCNHAADVDHAKADRIGRSGIRVMSVDMREGQFDWDDLWLQLISPRGDYHGLTSVLVEGGKRTWELFKNAGMMDEEVVLIGH